MIDILTVLLCSDPHGCADEALALQVHAAHERYEVVGFDEIVARGPMGQAALERWEAALAAVRQSPSVEATSEARAALDAVPFTVPAEDLLLVRPEAALEGSAFLSIAADETPARVFVDGLDVGAAPLTVDVAAGWHRVSVERPGRRTAWVGAFTVEPGGRADVTAAIALDDAEAALRIAVMGAMNGVMPTPEIAAMFVAAESRPVEFIRFVELTEGEGSERVPSVDGRGAGYAVQDAWLDVSEGRFVSEGPTMRSRSIPLQVGVSTGYLRLGARDHLQVEGILTVPVKGKLALDLRAGAARSAQPYLLNAEGQDFFVMPVSFGARLGRLDGGPYASLAALAVVPWAVGAEARGGYELRANRWLRAGVEVRGVATDKAFGGGAGLTISARP